jgi:hypothetical protein
MKGIKGFQKGKFIGGWGQSPTPLTKIEKSLKNI